jgi:hypothetical protein
MNPLAGYGVRAVRSFGPRSAMPTVPTTIAQSTTTNPVLTSTTVPITAKATSCATGSTCKVGDIGPGGGVVFFAASAPQPWGQYLEAPTKNIATNQFWCDNVSTDIPGAQATAIGTGRQNTIDIDAACKSGAGQAAADFVFGGKDDWYLPSKDELNAMYAQRTLLAMSGYYFSSSEAKPQFAWDQYMGDGTPYPQGKNNGREVRPIRAFGPIGSGVGTAGAAQSPIVAPTAPKPPTAPTTPVLPQNNGSAAISKPTIPTPQTAGSTPKPAVTVAPTVPAKPTATTAAPTVATAKPIPTTVKPTTASTIAPKKPKKPTKTTKTTVKG